MQYEIQRAQVACIRNGGEKNCRFTVHVCSPQHVAALFYNSSLLNISNNTKCKRLTLNTQAIPASNKVLKEKRKEKFEFQSQLDRSDFIVREIRAITISTHLRKNYYRSKDQGCVTQCTISRPWFTSEKNHTQF